MKDLWVVFGCLALAACDAGTSATSVASVAPVAVTQNLLTPADLHGVTLQVPDQTNTFIVGTVTNLGYQGYAGSSPQGQAQISFDGAGNVTITYAGGTTNALTWDAGLKAYLGSGQVSYGAFGTAPTSLSMTFYDDPGKPGVYIWKFVELNTSVPSYDTFVGYTAFTENPTAGVNFPTHGTAVYSGTVEATDQSFATAEGTITLSADLAKASISGEIKLDAGAAVGAATFGNAAAPINKGSSSTGFSSTLTSSDVSVASSGVSGAFSGTSGKDVAGGFYVNDSNGDGLAGAFSASSATQ